MTTINANMTSGIGWVPLAEADAQAIEPGFYVLDSENIIIGGPHRSLPAIPSSPWNGRWCDRAVAGSTAASHSSGATLTRYYPDANTGGSGGVTGEQVIRRIDTTLSYNTPNIEDSNVGVELLVPTVGSIILEAIGQLKTAWATCDSAQFVVDVVPYYNNVHELDLMAATNVWEAGLDYTIASTFSTIASSDRVKNETSPRVPGIVTGEYAVTQEESARVIAYVNRTGAAPTAGEINVILIVLEPAA